MHILQTPEMKAKIFYFLALCNFIPTAVFYFLMPKNHGNLIQNKYIIRKKKENSKV